MWKLLSSKINCSLLDVVQPGIIVTPCLRWNTSTIKHWNAGGRWSHRKTAIPPSFSARLHAHNTQLISTKCFCSAGGRTCKQLSNTCPTSLFSKDNNSICFFFVWEVHNDMGERDCQSAALTPAPQNNIPRIPFWYWTMTEDAWLIVDLCPPCTCSQPESTCVYTDLQCGFTRSWHWHVREACVCGLHRWCIVLKDSESRKEYSDGSTDLSWTCL